MSDRDDLLDRTGPDLGRVFDEAPVALSVLAPDGTLLRANAAHFSLFGVRDGSLDALRPELVVHPDERVAAASDLDDLAAGRTDRVEVQRRYVRPDGSGFTGHLTASRLDGDGGRATALVCCIEDVSEQVGAADHLEQARRRLTVLIANISDNVTLVDADGGVIESTGLHREILGYPQEFWASRSVFDLIPPEDVDRLMALRAQVLERPGEPVTADVRVRRADGSIHDMELNAVNLLDEPSVGGIVVTLRNITFRKQAEADLARRRDEAVEQSRLRSEFVARVSHELRNQVHALRGLTELLTSSDVPRSVRQLAGSAHRQAEQFEHLVDDLLEYTRLEASPPQPVPRATWPRQIVADAAGMARGSAAPGVEVVETTAEAVPDLVMIDAPRVRQVLANLVSNAAKFTERGRIRISLRPGPPVTSDGAGPDTPVLRFTVDDTGRGIDATDVQRIFLPFDQGSVHSTQGTGLGLSITERVVDVLGGTIRVTSQPGVGSSFEVDLPYTEATDADLPEEHAPAGSGTAVVAGTDVLVVEDNEVNQLLVAEQLRRLGVASTVVGTGTLALEHLATGAPVDCVLMDWQLPGIDGVETTRRIRASESPGSHLPIIGMTASAMPSDRRTCMEAGMDDLLVKPVGLRELAATLGRWTTARSAPVDRSTADVGALDRLVEDLGSVEPVRSIVQTYLTELDKRCELIERGTASGDADLVRRTAHTLRSTSRTLGANDLDRLSTALEEGPLPPPEDLMEHFRDAVGRTRLALGTWLEQSGGGPSGPPPG